jgi:hypothetical protein
MKTPRTIVSGLALISSIIATVLFFGMVSTSASAAPPPHHKTVTVLKVGHNTGKPTVVPSKAMGKLIKAGYHVDVVKSKSFFTAIGNHMGMIRTKFVLIFARVWHSITPGNGGGGNTCS